MVIKVLLIAFPVLAFVLYFVWKSKPEQKAVQEFRKATDLLASKRYEEAMQLLKEAHKIDEMNIDIIDALGISLHNLGRYQEAIPYLKKLIEAHPETTQYKVLLTNCYYHTAQYNKAIEVARVFPQITDMDLRGIQLLGASYAAKKEYDDAIAVLKEVSDEQLTSKVDFLDHHYNLGIIYEGNGELDNALAHFYKVFEVDRDYEDAAFILKELEDLKRSLS